MFSVFCCDQPAYGQADQFRVNFQRAGVGSALAVATECGDGKMLVAIAQPGTDVSKSVVTLDGKRVNAAFAGYDRVSGLCFFERADPPQSAPVVWLAKVPGETGAELRGGGVSGRTSGWVKRIGGKVLPFALVKIDFDGAPPMPGTSLTDGGGRVAALFLQMSEDKEFGYAIPAEAVERVMKDIRKGGVVAKGYLGVSLQVENERPQITRVIGGSPAAEAGIRQDDLISRIGTREVADYADVANAFFYMRPGVPVEVTIKRGARLLDFTLIPSAERPE